MPLNGIDISSNQPRGIASAVPYDFCIVKASGNPGEPRFKWNYVNEYMKTQADDVLKRTGLLGLYHFTYGIEAQKEADFFIKTVKKYIGRAMLIIDWEGAAVENGLEWLGVFIDRIIEKTGIHPVVYAGGSDAKRLHLLDYLKKKNCGLWVANYWLGYQQINGYTQGEGMVCDVPGAIMWQYTSSGRLEGFDGNLDLNVFYGTKENWLAYTVKDGETTQPIPTPEPTPTVSKAVPKGRYRILANVLNIRIAPSTLSKIAGQYLAGDSVVLDGNATVANGYVWGRYIGSTSHQYRYIAVRSIDGKEVFAKREG